MSREDLVRILVLLGGSPADLVRKDKRFDELGLAEGDYRSTDQIVALLLEHPELMQRPVVLRGQQAVIARPAEKVLALVDEDETGPEERAPQPPL